MSKTQKTPAAPPPQDDGNEGFLQRWSRIKQENTAANAASPPAAPQEAEAKVDAPPLTDEDMPPLDSLSEQSDLQPFLSSGVSDTLRRKAFRKIFLGGKFNIRDGLDDYDEDFTEFAALGDVVTAEYRRWQERMAKAQEEDAQTAEEVDFAESDAADETEQAEADETDTADTSPQDEKGKPE